MSAIIWIVDVSSLGPSPKPPDLKDLIPKYPKPKRRRKGVLYVHCCPMTVWDGIHKLILRAPGALKRPYLLPSCRQRVRGSPCNTPRLFHKRVTCKMPTRKFLTPNGKRKAEDMESYPVKRLEPINGTTPYKDSTQQIKYGIVLRKFYPPEMTNERAQQYISGQIERPVEKLEKAMRETETARENVQVKDSVVHYFKCDVRTKDNHALHRASEKAKSKGVPLIGLFICSPQDWEAHFTSAVRVDFVLRTLKVLQEDLAALDIPLYVETVERRKKIPSRIMELCEKWGTSHIYCNAEYEVDELCREATLTRDCLAKGLAFNCFPDTCIVEPGKVMGGSGQQMAVYSPWFRKWCAYLQQHPQTLEPYPAPERNPSSARQIFGSLFDCAIPSAPPNKQLSPEEKTRFRSMWPAGEAEAHARLGKFVSQKLQDYSEKRNFPAANRTAVISVHLASGTLSARAAVRAAQTANSTPALDGGLAAMKSWIGEIAWRDFYKHVLVHWPHVCMNKSFKPEYTSILWSYDEAHFKAWCEGKTGYPIVDAAMRQLNHTGYMHNRCRMIVASFLAKDLLIDWRMGERYFMERLIDGDFASNNGGWGFSASSGVDPQPYFRIFNPLLQSEKFDAKGDYIRKWIPELEDLMDSKGIHDPYGRGFGTLAKKNGYPKAVVDHRISRVRTLNAYKEGLGRSNA